jgi:hypothetical protein
VAGRQAAKNAKWFLASFGAFALEVPGRYMPGSILSPLTGFRSTWGILTPGLVLLRRTAPGALRLHPVGIPIMRQPTKAGFGHVVSLYEDVKEQPSHYY